jgi:iron complex outermembrane receptor protein
LPARWSFRWRDGTKASTGAGETTNPKYGLRWKPFNALLLRGSYGTGYRAPALTELERPESDSNPQVTDPKRKNERYAVLVTTGSNPNLEPETSKTYNVGAIVNVPFTKGLSFGVDYYRKEQRNLSTSLTNQQLIDAEDFITGRITRSEPSAADLAAGLAGRITKLDARYVNFGLVVTEGYDVSANYSLTTRDWGRFTFMASTTTLMSYKIALTPTDPLTDRKGSYGFPLDFKGNGYVFWNRGGPVASRSPPTSSTRLTGRAVMSARLRPLT